jgi:xylose isomerase
MRMIKYSVGVWAFGPAVTRFVPPAYHQEIAQEPMVEKRRKEAKEARSSGGEA